MYSHLIYTVSGPTCHITLNRPDVYHALNSALIGELTAAMQAAGADQTVRVVILTGSGNQAFCSGADLKEASQQMGAADWSAGELLRSTYHPMIRAIRELPKPVICRLNGIAVGAGCSLALAGDVVIATDESYLSLLFVQIGLMPDAGSTFFLPRLIGARKAFELCSTGRRVYGPEAAQLGLVNRSVPAAQLDEAVAELAAYYATAPTQAIGAMKRALNESYAATLEEQLETEARGQDQLGRSQDVAEGMTAFLTKRKPVFGGN